MIDRILPFIIPVMLALPLVLSVILFFLRSDFLNRLGIIIYAVIHSACTVCLYFYPQGFTEYFRVNQVNIIFLIVLSLLYLGISFYNFSYTGKSEIGITGKTYYTICLLNFVAAMTGVILSNHLAMLWIFIEATTLTSAYLIYFEHKKSSLEASWKYIFICSIGISLAFMGIIFLSKGMPHNSSLFFDDLYRNAKSIDPLWLKLAFVFILIGLGTKMGLSPLHAWLPDAHSEAPSPISALLSGALLNAAFIGIFRFNRLMSLAGLENTSRTLLLIMGFLSILFSAAFILRQDNYKRMLAYSSIENMGIIAIGITLGKPGLYAALIHVAGHSLAKASLFLTSGNILKIYKSKNISGVRGLLDSSPATGWIWIFSLVAIAGIPPSPIFFSEFLIARSFFEHGEYLLLFLFLFLLTIVLFGLAKNIFRMTSGFSEIKPKKLSFLYFAPQIIFLLILLIIGLGLSGNINGIFANAVQ